MHNKQGNLSTPDHETQQLLCTFYVGNLFLGMDIHKVQEVVRFQPLTRVAQCPPMVKGLINLRGRIMTAIDMGILLQLSNDRVCPLPMNVVAYSEHGLVSLLVDRVDEVMGVTEMQFERVPPTFSDTLRPYIKGTYKMPNRILLLLDSDAILAITAAKQPL